MFVPSASISGACPVTWVVNPQKRSVNAASDAMAEELPWRSSTQ